MLDVSCGSQFPLHHSSVCRFRTGSDSPSPSPHLSGCSCIWKCSTTFSSSWLTWIRAAAGEFDLRKLISPPPLLGSLYSGSLFSWLFHFSTTQNCCQNWYFKNFIWIFTFLSVKTITKNKSWICLFNFTITYFNTLNATLLINFKWTTITVL